MSASWTSCRVGSLLCSRCGSVSAIRTRPPSPGPIPPPSRRPNSGSLVHLDLGHHPTDRGIPPGKRDAGRLADQTASSVAPDEILRSERPAVAQVDVDAGVVLSETRHLAATKDRNPELIDPAGQDGLGVALREREPVVVPGGKVADVQPDPGETLNLHRLPRREEAIGDAALVEDLDGARVQAACGRADAVLAGAPLDNGDVDPRQRQLARQHQARRTSAGDHHRMLHHRHAPSGITPRILAPPRRVPPPVRRTHAIHTPTPTHAFSAPISVGSGLRQR